MYDKMALMNALAKHLHLYACTECFWPPFESMTVQAEQKNQISRWNNMMRVLTADLGTFHVGTLSICGWST